MSDEDFIKTMIPQATVTKVDTRMKVINGDLLQYVDEGVFDVIVHGCNCFHVMGAGIALQIAKKYPDAMQADINNSVSGDVTKLGKFTEATVMSESGGLTIINAYTQFSTGGFAVSYDAIDKVFKEIARTTDTSLSIGYPMIGAGLAGGDWDIIKVIIDKALEAHDHTLVEYAPHPQGHI